MYCKCSNFWLAAEMVASEPAVRQVAESSNLVKLPISRGRGQPVKPDGIALTVADDGHQALGADTRLRFENPPALVYGPCRLIATVGA